MRRIRHARFAVALVAGFAAAGLAACGSDEEPRGLIPASQADTLSRDLAEVRELVDAGECDRARTAAERLNARLNSLSPTVDARLRGALSDGVGRLQLLIDEPDACQAQTETMTVETTTTTTTAPPPPVTTPPEEEKKPEKEKKKEEEEAEVPGEDQEEAPPEGTEGGGIVIPEEEPGGGVPPGNGGGVSPGQ